MKYSELLTYQGYIYLTSIYEPEDNSLILTIERCRINETSEDIRIGDNIIEDTHSIDIDNSLPILRFEFNWYIRYSITNESFSIMDDYEVYEGKAFRIYKRSRYLDFINVSTIASDDYPGPFKHYGITALNHIVDVVATEPPTITLINRDAII
ncbi:hypothetical protein [Litchfieldia salsa]|uniref:Uncharacterized protein n=1 Tax=Litchfieldia salsa TaxID=930152 RepID=A0A1H0X011_9BACI|nr:hypothetical protein [Litchfieldia salsa]SDP96252.1 hypothetical protein SAMN05216565_1215 [Litchfieldia salsa]